MTEQKVTPARLQRTGVWCQPVVEVNAVHKSTVLSPLGNAAQKHEKPYPEYPLFPHASGRWAKKVRGKFAYFGKIADDPKGEAALHLWLDQ